MRSIASDTYRKLNTAKKVCNFQENFKVPKTCYVGTVGENKPLPLVRQRLREIKDNN